VTAMDSKVGVIGLGTMGLPMATNLHAAGHVVLGMDLDDTRKALAADADILVAPDLASLVAGVSVIVTSLPGADQLEKVAADIVSMSAALSNTGSSPELALVVDTTTSHPPASKGLLLRWPKRASRSWTLR
jgi:3-hydroxyisobutyrate dehydrogenase-like beta-hydroxyacid dehydrogenase